MKKCEICKTEEATIELKLKVNKNNNINYCCEECTKKILNKLSEMARKTRLENRR